jgi:hypothetical protein
MELFRTAPVNPLSLMNSPDGSEIDLLSEERSLIIIADEPNLLVYESLLDSAPTLILKL